MSRNGIRSRDLLVPDPDDDDLGYLANAQDRPAILLDRLSQSCPGAPGERGSDFCKLSGVPDAGTVLPEDGPESPPGWTFLFPGSSSPVHDAACREGRHMDRARCRMEKDEIARGERAAGYPRPRRCEERQAGFLAATFV